MADFTPDPALVPAAHLLDELLPADGHPLRALHALWWRPPGRMRRRLRRWHGEWFFRRHPGEYQQGVAAELRHQMDDPCEPPLACPGPEATS